MTNKLKNFSTTPGNNNSTPPFGWPEGMAPSTVNDTARQDRASLREWYEDAEWRDLGHTFVSTAGQVISLSGNVSAFYSAGQAIRVNGTLVGTITVVAFSTNTQLTVDGFTPPATVTQLEVGTAVSTVRQVIRGTSKVDFSADSGAVNVTTAGALAAQFTTAGDLAMQSHKVTGLLAGVLATDAPNIGQVQAGSVLYAGTAGGSATVITATLAPAIAAYAAGQVYSFKASAASTGAATLNINSVGAASLTRLDGTALQAGDIQNGQIAQVEYDGAKFQLLNRYVANATTPAGTLLNVQTFTSSGTYTPTSGTTKAISEQVGGGGGAGGAASNNSATVIAGVGGGSGAYARQIINSPGTLSVTIGAAGTAGSSAGSGGNGGSGGSTIFNGVTTSGGTGGGGAKGTTSPNSLAFAGAAGGTVSGGSPTVSIPGQASPYIWGVATGTAANNIGNSGAGANSPLGLGGSPLAGAAGSNLNIGGANGTGYGAGGGGAISTGTGGAGGGVAGGAGTAGILIIYEYS